MGDFLCLCLCLYFQKLVPLHLPPAGTVQTERSRVVYGPRFAVASSFWCEDVFFQDI